MAAAGSTAAVGTGAFTSVEADRSIGVEVADEETASYLVLDAVDSTIANGAFAANDGTGGAITFDFNNEIPDTVNGDGGEGPGRNSTYEFDNVFDVENKGTQQIEVTIEELSNADGDFDPATNGTLQIRFYPDSDVSSPLHTNPVTVGVGNTQSVGVEIVTGDVDLISEAYDASALVEADAV